MLLFLPFQIELLSLDHFVYFIKNLVRIEIINAARKYSFKYPCRPPTF